MATSDTVQTRRRLETRFLETKGRVIVSLSIKKSVHIHTCFIFENMPIVLATELGDRFLGLKGDVCTGVHVLLVQPYMPSVPLPDTTTLWHLLLFHLTRAKLLPKDGVIRHPRLYGLPKYRFGEIRGQSAHDGLEAIRPASLRRSLALFFGFGSRL
jgi:hypothetical protein